MHLMLAGDLKLLVCWNCVVWKNFECTKIKGTKIILHVKLPTFTVAIVEGFYSMFHLFAVCWSLHKAAATHEVTGLLQLPCCPYLLLLGQSVIDHAVTAYSKEIRSWQIKQKWNKTAVLVNIQKWDYRCLSVDALLCVEISARQRWHKSCCITHGWLKVCECPQHAAVDSARHSDCVLWWGNRHEECDLESG